jgi:hypothetical protein
MSSILEMLTDQLGGDATSKISQQLGTDEGTAGKAISAALPLLMGALARNATKADGAQSLAGALERDHDGSILDDVSGFLSNPESGSGDGIVRHTLGPKRAAVEQELGRQTGLDVGAVTKLLPMLAPLVMGALGREKRQGQLDIGGLTSMLSGERERAEGAGASLGGLASLLDSDADGDIKDDVAKMGAGLLGKLFGGKKS